MDIIHTYHFFFLRKMFQQWKFFRILFYVLFELCLFVIECVHNKKNIKNVITFFFVLTTGQIISVKINTRARMIFVV